MKILLSYSKNHFNPSKRPEEHKFWGHSASILAKSLYEIISNIGDVTYIDSSEIESIREQQFDLFVGVYNNFYKIINSCNIKKSIYFAVNMHPKERNSILIKYLLRERLSPLALSGWDLLNVIETTKGINYADYILCIGNIVTYNSYLKHGISKSKIKTLNYGINKNPRQIDKLTTNSGKKRYIYVTSEIGLRKGFDIIYSLFTDSEIINKEFHLDIVGLPTNSYYKNKLKKFLKLLDNKVKYYGWVDTSSKKYWEIIDKNDYVILSSLEEGQAGTVIESISRGIVPIVSGNTGIDFSPLGQLETKINSLPNKKLLLNSLNLSQKSVADLKKKTIEYYEDYHKNFKENLTEAIKGCIEGDLYPKISITLPIYNKEKTIKPLLKLLHQACNEYKNVELHLIFDGCQDKTEIVAKEFYKKIGDYAITYERTPNIFEIKTNNIGLKKSTGKYCVIVQDDNYIFDKNIFFEAVNFLEKNIKVAILGGLAGVNYYPRGTKNLTGNGQITINKNEVYWRQDGSTDSQLKKRIFEVDACMRGPLFFRKEFLEKFGYLDEIYAPFYMDDMDICYRARKFGFKVYCILSDILNTSSTIAKYDEKKWKFWDKIISRNADIFYSRWKFTSNKNYLFLNRFPVRQTLIDSLLISLNKIHISKINSTYLLNLAYKVKNKILSS